ncbi:MAG: GntR family transcriptional regulator [Planctomycetota bacterium]|nr:GntR family transcriptional regulator [Planctomycetota bacterium]
MTGNKARLAPGRSAPTMVGMTKLELAAAHIRDAIMTGAIAPGERVVIDQIARQLAISPIPVREALKQLEAEQLVAIKPHVGAVVTPLARHDIVEVFDLLTALEQVAARHACQHRSDDDLQHIRGLVGAMEQLADGTDPKAWVAANNAFHAAMAAAAGMDLVLDCTRRTQARWQRIRLTLFELEAGEDLHRVNAEHAEMLQALEQRDETHLQALIAEHNNGARTWYLGRS